PLRSMKSKRATAGAPGATLIVTTVKWSRSNSLSWVSTFGMMGSRPTTEGGSSRKMGSMAIAPGTISGRCFVGLIGASCRCGAVDRARGVGHGGGAGGRRRERLAAHVAGRVVVGQHEARLRRVVAAGVLRRAVLAVVDEEELREAAPPEAAVELRRISQVLAD